MAQDRRQIGCVGPEAFLRAASIVKIHPIPLEGSNLHCYQTTIASGQAKFLNDTGVLRLSRIRACREITESLLRTHQQHDDMVGAGRPSMARGAELTNSVQRGGGGRHERCRILNAHAVNLDIVLLWSLYIAPRDLAKSCRAVCRIRNRRSRPT